MSRAFFIEALFTDDPERERLPTQSPWSIIDHPFRVIVFDSSFNLLAIATVTLGSITEPTRLARLFAETRPGYWSAVVLNRADLTTEKIFCRPIKDPHADSLQ